MSGIGMGGFGKLPRPQEIRTCERETEASTGQGCGDPTCPICMPSNPRDRGGGKVGGGNGNTGRDGMDMNEMARRLAASREASMASSFGSFFGRPSFGSPVTVDVSTNFLVPRNDAPSGDISRVVQQVNAAYGSMMADAALERSADLAVEAGLDRDARHAVYLTSRMPGLHGQRFQDLCEAKGRGRVAGQVTMPPGDMGLVRALMDKKRAEWLRGA